MAGRTGNSLPHRRRLGEALSTPSVFLTTDVGFVGGYGIWKTNDGGDNWIDIDPGLGDSIGYEIWFVDANNGIFGTGSCLSDTTWFGRTTDGGANWTVQSVVSSRFDGAVGRDHLRQRLLPCRRRKRTLLAVGRQRADLEHSAEPDRGVAGGISRRSAHPSSHR